MCLNLEQIKKIAIVDKNAEKIIKNFMPGPLTIILKKKKDLDNYITNGKQTIAVRLATSKELEYIIKKINTPLFMTSANISGELPCNNLGEIINTFPDIDAVLEGKVKYNEASTILDCSSSKIMIIREGPILYSSILKII